MPVTPSAEAQQGGRVSPARGWGTTAAERGRAYPCDEQLPGATDSYFRAVDVDAPPETLFLRLCQLRVAPYSYDWIDNWGRRSPRELTPGLDELELGQGVMTIFELVAFEAPRHITLRMRRGQRLFGEIAVSYAIEPRDEDGCRLVMKLAVDPPGGLARLTGFNRALPWLDLIMARRQLLNLKALAERDAAASSSAIKPLE